MLKFYSLISIPKEHLLTKNEDYKSFNLSVNETCHLFMSRFVTPIHALIT